LKDCEPRPILVDPDICATHSSFTGKGRPTVHYAMVVDD
jgi:hypothetical protein